MSTEQRKRSREYAKPEEIKVSPAPKRDLFTGLLVPDTPEALFLQRVTDFVAKNLEALPLLPHPLTKHS